MEGFRGEETARAEGPAVRQEVPAQDQARDVVFGSVLAARIPAPPRIDQRGRFDMRTRRGEGWAYRRKGVWYVSYYADGKKMRESTGCTKEPEGVEIKNGRER